MRKIFEVHIHFDGGLDHLFTIIASNDVEARDKAVMLDTKSWGNFKALGEVPGIEYCEIKMISEVDE